jgi:hypothetical protein
MAEWNLGSASVREGLLEQYAALVKREAVHKASEIERCTDVTGSMIFNSKSVLNSYDVYNAEDSKNIVLVVDVKDSMDAYHFGFRSELAYEAHGLTHVYDVMFSHLSYDDSHLMYCDSCHNSQDLFGCVGVRQGNNVIMNKKYTATEYPDLKEKIIRHMKETGEFGEFFPPQLSPFGYNETQGNIYMPLSKEEALRQGYAWEDQVPGTFGKETVNGRDIPDDITQVEDSIQKEILACETCGKNYNIVRPELDFYRLQRVPLPRRCPDCRYKRRIAERPRRAIITRRCACIQPAHVHGQTGCEDICDTPFTEDDAARIFCTSCYQAEVA